MGNPDFCYAKTKTQNNCAVTAQLSSAFVFATLMVQSLFFLNPKFQSSSLQAGLCQTGRKSGFQFSHLAAQF